MEPKQLETAAMNTEPRSTGDVRSKSAARRRMKVCVIVGAILLAVVVILIIVGATVFKAKKPITTVESVSLSDFDVSVDLLRFAVHLNLTLDARVSVRNPNRVGFKYQNSSVSLKYRGDEVGDAPIPAGKIGARETKPMNVTITLMADRILSNRDLFTDVTDGALPLSTYTKITGKVRFLFNIRVKSVSTCDLFINVGSRSVVNQTCQYKTKL